MGKMKKIEKKRKKESKKEKYFSFKVRGWHNILEQGASWQYSFTNNTYIKYPNKTHIFISKLRNPILPTTYLMVSIFPIQ